MIEQFKTREAFEWDERALGWQRRDAFFQFPKFALAEGSPNRVCLAQLLPPNQILQQSSDTASLFHVPGLHISTTLSCACAPSPARAGGVYSMHGEIMFAKLNQRSWIQPLAAVMCALWGVGAAHATQATVSGDTYVNAALPAVNFGRLSNMYVNSSGTALIQFDLSSLPTGTTAAQIGKATLTLYVNRLNASGVVSVQPVTGSWTESTVTYSTMPSLGASVASFTPSAAGQFVTVDVTPLVQSWVTNPSTNFGLALTSASGDLVLDSKENDETSHVSALNITVVSQGPQGLQGLQGPAGATGPAGPQGPQGLQGPAGATGPVGPQGATGTIGAVSNYSGSTAYSLGAVVYCPTGGACSANAQGASWISLIASNQGHDPYTTSGTDWQEIAAAGAQGAAGAIGPQGPAGTPGPMGPAGPQGTPGPMGQQGPAGPSGAIGPQGPAGPAGAAGPQGPQGPAGTIGAVTSYSSTATYSLGNVVYCPNPGACVSADQGSSYVYINAASSSGNDPSNTTYWQEIAAAGAQGPQGPAGATGPAGPTGPQGPAGANGSSATGASPSGVPVMVSSIFTMNNNNILFCNPYTGSCATSYGALSTSQFIFVPTACTPSITGFNNTTEYMHIVVFNEGYGQGQTAASTSPNYDGDCYVGPGQSCSTTAPPLGSNSYVTIGVQTFHNFSTSGTVAVAFSCN